MLPKYRRLVELLAQAGLLKIICGTDTLGVGINVPIRTVLLTSLSKYDGVKPRLLTAREFHQIGGRAGRAGYDASGTVIIQAPDHVVANEKALAKAGDDPKKRRKVVRKKPPEGTVGYGLPTYERLISAEPEPLESSFAVSHSMLLNVINRPGDCYAVDAPPADRQRRAARTPSRSRPPGVVDLSRAAELRGGRAARRARRVRSTGPADRRSCSRSSRSTSRSPRSRWPRSTCSTRRPTTYPLDVLSVIEATLEDPRPVLTAQRSKARGEAVEAMKREGIEYEERMALLEDVTYPKPLADLLGVGYAAYARDPPVGARPRAGSPSRWPATCPSAR